MSMWESNVNEFNTKIDSIIKDLDMSIDDNHYIYHYTSANALESIISGTSLRFTRWDFLNDESETLQIHDIIKRCLKDGIYSHTFKDTFREMNQITESLRKDDTYRKENYYILSFSSNPDSVPMWTYYTKSDQSDGYNIGFNSNILYKHLNYKTIFESIKSVKLVKLIYDKSRKKEIVTEFLNSIHSLYVKSNKETDKVREMMELFESGLEQISMYFKHEAFMYENEYRIIIKSTYENEKSMPKNGVFIPYIELDFPKECVDCINISPTLSKRNPHMGIKTLLRNNGYDKCGILYSTIPFRNI